MDKPGDETPQVKPPPSLCPFCKVGRYEPALTAGVYRCGNCGSVALPGKALDRTLA